ncbi:MAG: FAD-binding oxidoreductase [Gemmatimonadota bacterium]
MAADVVLKELSAACSRARAAGPEDAVAGVTPRYAASPASVAEASAVLRAASAHGLAVVPRGSGSKLAWGAPPARCDLVVDTLGLDQVLEHAAGDLVARVQAGVPLDRLAGVLAGAGQQFPVDTGGAGTAGGVLATALAGPRRLRYGTPRDLVIGITVVRADGTVARSGGKVVKNVAGYDLGKLFAGSYGTLGLIAEAVFRLHPLPAGTAFVTVECDSAEAAARAVAAAAASDASPAAVEIGRAARGAPVQLAVLLEGEAAALADRSAVLERALGTGARTAQDAPPWWGGPLDPAAAVAGGGPAGTSAGAASVPGSGAGSHGSGEDGTLIRIGFWAGALAGVLAAVDQAGLAAGADPAVGGSAAAGVLYTRLPADTPAPAVAAFVTALRAALARPEARPPGVPADVTPAVLASAVVLHAPPAVQGEADLWGPVPALSLMRAVKDQFDPGHLMAPGRFAGGI